MFLQPAKAGFVLFRGAILIAMHCNVYCCDCKSPIIRVPVSRIHLSEPVTNYFIHIFVISYSWTVFQPAKAGFVTFKGAILIAGAQSGFVTFKGAILIAMHCNL